MASEDIFGEYTEEIVSEPQQENAELEEETEDFTALLNNEDEEANEEEEVNNENDDNGATTENTAETNTESEKVTQTNEKTTEAKLIQLPLTRIRNIMKLDPDLNIASNEALFAVTRATELFIESLSRESYVYTQQAKKKTVQKRDVDMAIAAVDSLMFLEGAMNF